MPVGTTEPGDRPEPVAAPLEPEPEPGLPRTRRWPVEQRFGRVRLLAQGLFVSAGLAAALIVTHLAVSAPAATTRPSPPPGGATARGGTVAPTSPTGAGGATPAPATATTRPPVTATTRPPVTATTAPPVTTTTVCYSTPSGHVTCY